MVSTERPLLVLFSGAADLHANWLSLPEDVRAAACLRVEALPSEELEAACEEAERWGIPILVQVAGPHDFYGGTSSRISLSEMECLYQRFRSVWGAFLCEQACQNGGLRNPDVRCYAERIIRLSAGYGRLALWADGHWGRYLWLEAAADEELRAAMRTHRGVFFPVWKMNCGLTPYSIHGTLLGLWLDGTVDAWGVEPESWYWFEAGFRGRGEQAWFKEGDPQRMPASFAGQMLLLGMGSGAAVYVLEPPSLIWECPGVLAASWTRHVWPLLERILRPGVLPAREQVWLSLDRVLVLEDAPFWRYDYDPALHELYRRFYRPASPFDVLPKAGGSPVPLFLQRALDRSRADLDLPIAERLDGAVLLARKDARPPGPAGAAWTGRAGALSWAMNSSENAACEQAFELRLTGAFQGLAGRLGTNELLVATQPSPAELDVLLDVGMERALPELEVVLVDGATGPPVLSSVRDAAASATWNAARRTLAVRFSGDAPGAREVRIQVP